MSGQVSLWMSYLFACIMTYSSERRTNKNLVIFLVRAENPNNTDYLVFHLQPPDVGSELTGGCYGFATKFMHWPEDLVVGGTVKNKTGHITR